MEATCNFLISDYDREFHSLRHKRITLFHQNKLNSKFI